MKRQLQKTLAAGLVVTFGMVNPLLAGSSPVGPNPIIFVPPSFVVPPAINVPTSDPNTGVPGDGVTGAQTQSIVDSLKSANLFCSALPQSVYTVDCMSERLEAVAKAMPSTGGYAEARTAILDASRKLHKLAIANAAPDLPRVYMRTAGEEGIRTTRPLVAVDPASVAEVGQQASQILEELETVLLRSGEASAERKSHYSRIAAAAGSNKVLLRSL